MSKPSATRRIPGLSSVPTPKVPKVSGRRTPGSGTSKRTLIEVAQELFTEQGYAATSLDQIVAGARVTKGALYHHFTGKQALFEAVFEQVEGAAGRAVQASLKGKSDPWVKAQAGLRTFLEVVQQPSYRRVVIQDGPSVLGYERFRSQEERSTFTTVTETVRDMLTAGTLALDEEMLQTFSGIFFGAMSSAGQSVATSDDPVAAAVRAEAAIRFILAGLQSLIDAGVDPLASPTSPR